MFKKCLSIGLCLTFIGGLPARADGFDTFLQGILAGLKEYIVQVDNQQVRVWSLLNYIDTHEHNYLFGKRTDSAGVGSSLRNLSKIIDQYYMEKGFAALPILRTGWDTVHGGAMHTVVGSLEQIADRADVLKNYIQTGQPYEPGLESDPEIVKRLEVLFQERKGLSEDLKGYEERNKNGERNMYGLLTRTEYRLGKIDDEINSLALRSPRYGWDKDGNIRPILGKSNNAPGWTSAHNLLTRKIYEIGDLLTEGQFSEKYPIRQGRGVISSGKIAVDSFNNMLEALNFEVEKFNAQDKTTGVNWRAMLDDGIRELEQELTEKDGEWGPSISATIQEVRDAKYNKQTIMRFRTKTPYAIAKTEEGQEIELREALEVTLDPEEIEPFLRRTGAKNGIMPALNEFISAKSKPVVEVSWPGSPRDVTVKRGRTRVGLFSDVRELIITGATPNEVIEGMKRFSVKTPMPRGLPGQLYEHRLSEYTGIALATPFHIPSLVMAQKPTSGGTEIYGMGPLGPVHVDMRISRVEKNGTIIVDDTASGSPAYRAGHHFFTTAGPDNLVRAIKEVQAEKRAIGGSAGSMSKSFPDQIVRQKRFEVQETPDLARRIIDGSRVSDTGTNPGLNVSGRGGNFSAQLKGPLGFVGPVVTSNLKVVGKTATGGSIIEETEAASGPGSKIANVMHQAGKNPEDLYYRSGKRLGLLEKTNPQAKLPAELARSHPGFELLWVKRFEVPFDSKFTQYVIDRTSTRTMEGDIAEFRGEAGHFSARSKLLKSAGPQLKSDFTVVGSRNGSDGKIYTTLQEAHYGTGPMHVRAGTVHKHAMSPEKLFYDTIADLQKTGDLPYNISQYQTASTTTPKASSWSANEMPKSRSSRISVESRSAPSGQLEHRDRAFTGPTRKPGDGMITALNAASRAGVEITEHKLKWQGAGGEEFEYVAKGAPEALRKFRSDLGSQGFGAGDENSETQLRKCDQLLNEF